MVDVNKLSAQVKHNCNISDARYWDSYSICGLLFRLRDLYRTEKNIQPWMRIPKNEIGEWISERENLWNKISKKDFESITINGESLDPFDVEKINALLEQEKLLYGAGFGINMKPSFFLADLLSKETIDGFMVYTAGQEYVRDLSTYPALLQDGTIITRIDSTKLLLWQQFEELRGKRLKCALTYAFSKYGLAPDDAPSERIDREISRIARSEAYTYIYHELGEAREGQRIGNEWTELLGEMPRSKTEIFVRSVKDILSDTSDHGLLKHIIMHQKEGSLGFYLVFMSGFRKTLFPEILEAFKIFMEAGNWDWECIESARQAGYERGLEISEELLSMYRMHKKDKDYFLKLIDQRFLSNYSK